VGGTHTIEATHHDDDVLIAIEDTGPGVSRDSLGYLFEPLVTSKSLGLGLGLATAKALIENQGGSIRYSTGGAGGARFLIRVPRADE
jgi:C4-dicarboxylate-specific signal transduction histidine kinase